MSFAAFLDSDDEDTIPKMDNKNNGATYSSTNKRKRENDSEDDDDSCDKDNEKTKEKRAKTPNSDKQGFEKNIKVKAKSSTTQQQTKGKHKENLNEDKNLKKLNQIEDFFHLLCANTNIDFQKNGRPPCPRTIHECYLSILW